MTRRNGSISAGVALGVLAELASPGFALAQEPTPSPSPSQDGATGGVTTMSPEATALVLIVLIAAAVTSLAMLLWFNREALREYYLAALKLGGAGIVTVPELVPGGGPQGPLEATATPALTITGPTSAVVGVPTEYKASVSASWSLAPEGAGAVNPTEGEAVRVTPAQSGILMIKASKDTANAVMQVAVLEPSKVVKLPFVGRGYGTIAIGIVAIFVVFGLGIIGRLGPEAIATFFGGLLGVGAARAVSNDKGSSGEGSGD